jgi:hypothetical protein
MILNLSVVEQGVWYAGIALSIAVLVKLVLLGLVGRYAAVAAFLAVSVGRSILLASIPFATNAYAEAYLYTAPVLYGVQIWLLLHIYGHAFESYRGIAALGRWTILAFLLAGAALAAATTLWDHNPAREPFPILGLTFKLEAIVTKTLLAFLLLICAVLAWFPIPQRRNVRMIGFGTTALFIALTAGLVVRGLNPSAWTRLASTSALYVYAGCMGLWALTLKSRALDVVNAPQAPALESGQAALAGQLSEMNRLLESLRKAG